MLLGVRSCWDAASAIYSSAKAVLELGGEQQVSSGGLRVTRIAALATRME